MTGVGLCRAPRSSRPALLEAGRPTASGSAAWAGAAARAWGWRSARGGAPARGQRQARERGRRPDPGCVSDGVLGEIHFGELHNTHAHEAIVKDRRLFGRVQRRTVSRGRQAKSERLLARLGVLRCGTCGSRMVINSDSGSYRCGDTSANRCQRRAAVKADRVEEIVLNAIRAYSTPDQQPPGCHLVTSRSLRAE